MQIKGYPVRLELNVALVFSANPEDYTARGKIVTPLKDRIGSQFAPTMRKTSKRDWPSPHRRRGQNGSSPIWKSPTTFAKSWNR